jgi:hypothetical protein
VRAYVPPCKGQCDCCSTNGLLAKSHFVAFDFVLDKPMLSSTRAFVVVCEGNFASDFEVPGHDCAAIHSIARDGSSGFYAFDTMCNIPSIMQLLGCSAIGGSVSGFPEGSGTTFSSRYSYDL